MNRVSLFILALSLSSLYAESKEAQAPIFDGASLTGWTTNKEEFASHWKAEKGMIVGDNPDEQGSTLWTDAEFKDFELTLDYQTDSPDYDSGVFVRGKAHQVQIGVSRSLKKDLTGCIYAPADKQGKYPAETDKVGTHHKLGEWNHLRIRVVGPNVETYLNGEPFVTYQAPTIPKKGPIGLQLHAGVHQKMLFRNLLVKKASYPEPPVVDPQYDGAPVSAPEGATVLFDGQDTSLWKQVPKKGKELEDDAVQWTVENGYLEVIKGTGFIHLREPLLTSGHLHIEWATPAEVVGSSQGRGNSGVFIGGYPEVQVLDSYENKTYFDGQAGALYKQRPPMVNASRPPGEWQSYDIHFTRAELDQKGKVTSPALLTVYHNGVLIQDHFATLNAAQEGILRLQDHSNPVRFRNIWFLPSAE